MASPALMLRSGDALTLLIGVVLAFIGSVVLGRWETNWRGCGWAALALSAAVPFVPALPYAVWILGQPDTPGQFIMMPGAHGGAILVLIGGLVLTLLLWPLTWFGSLLGMWYAQRRRGARRW